jgi:hypothetical protein
MSLLVQQIWNIEIGGHDQRPFFYGGCFRNKFDVSDQEMMVVGLVFFERSVKKELEVLR